MPTLKPDAVIQRFDSEAIQQLERQRPIADAAAAVEATAARAAVMLDQIKQGWLWALLTRPAKQKAQG